MAGTALPIHPLTLHLEEDGSVELRFATEGACAAFLPVFLDCWEALYNAGNARFEIAQDEGMPQSIIIRGEIQQGLAILKSYAQCPIENRTEFEVAVAEAAAQKVRWSPLRQAWMGSVVVARMKPPDGP
jgi:hypothetical protein